MSRDRSSPPPDAALLRAPAGSLDADVRQLVQDLIDAYRDGVRLLRGALAAQSMSAEMDLVAEQAVEAASRTRADAAIDRAISAVAAASRASDREGEFSALWAHHRLTAEAAVSRAADLLRRTP